MHTPLFLEIENNPDSESILIENFDKRFEVITTRGDGNCLFHAVCQQDKRYKYKQLREKVCNYYLELDKTNHPVEDTLQWKLIKIQIPGLKNIYDICKQGTWGSTVDITAIAIILQRPVITFVGNQIPNNHQYRLNEDVDDSFIDEPPILIYSNSNSHFEEIRARNTNSENSKAVSSKSKKCEIQIRRNPNTKSEKSRRHQQKGRMRFDRDEIQIISGVVLFSSLAFILRNFL